MLAASAAAAGSLVAVLFKKISHLGLCVLISFAAGALLAVALFDILPEAIEQAGPVYGILSFFSGYLLFFLLTKFVFHICPACSATHTEVNFRAITVAMLVALSVHSFMDGLAIYSGASTGSSSGYLILLAVTYHKFPEGMALSLVAIGSGMSRLRAFFLSVLVETLTTLAGGAAGYLILMPKLPVWAGCVLGHAGGGFVFLVIHALLSEVVKHHPRYTIIAAIAGAFSIAVAGYCIGAF